MTATSTAELEGILAARKTELVPPPKPVEEPIPEADVVTGEIVPAASEIAAVAPSAEVVVHYPEIPPRVLGGLPYIRDYKRLALTICNTEFVPKKLQGRPDAITATYMAGYEHGMGPMQSLDSFNVIEGKVGLSAEAMRALIMQAGHLFVLSEGEGYAEVYARRKDWPDDFPSQKYRYDMGDAETAQLLRASRSGQPTGWQKNPRAMLAARATSGAARAYFADVLAGMSYTPEEIRDFTDEGEAPTWNQSPPASSTPAVAASPIPVQERPTSTSSVPTTAPASDATPPAAVESLGAEPQGSTPATTTEPPKRPRGRPRKNPAPAPTDDSPASTSASPSTFPSPTPPPELTSLDAAIDVTASTLNADPTAQRAPGEGAVLVQTRHTLVTIIAGLPEAQQPLCRAFIRQHFPEGAEHLNADELQKCIDIAAGWPDSAVQHPVPEFEDEDAF